MEVRHALFKDIILTLTWRTGPTIGHLVTWSNLNWVPWQ